MPFPTDRNSPRPRTQRILDRVGEGLPRLSIERARYFTETFRRTEHLPLVLRWARGMVSVMRHLPVRIQPDELLVGRAGPEGRYGILYPELEGAYFAEADALRETYAEAQYAISPEDLECLRTDIVPYWVGRTFREAVAHTVPAALRRLFYKEGNIYEPTCVVHESATLRHSLQWVLDYRKVIERGFCGIYEEAQARCRALRVDSPTHNFDKAPFYEAVMELCLGVRDFALRHAEEAERLAGAESDPGRAAELHDMAAVCRRVPWQPARTFHEAMQAQWFTQLVSRLEQMHGGVVGNGRIDQYLYPFYTADMAAGRIDDRRVLELLDCLWCHSAQFKRLQVSAAGVKSYEDHAHWEHTTIGGLKPDGSDATNALSFLVLRSYREFPLDYPDLGVRVHESTPDPFLTALCRVPRVLTGVAKPMPKLLNDEEIIPRLTASGAELAEARDYCGSGFSEARLINRHTYMTGTTWFNLAAVLEMTLFDGRCHASGQEALGLRTGDPCLAGDFETFFRLFRRQLEHIILSALAQQFVTDSIRARFLAAPLLSALHDLCMGQGEDINIGRFDGGISLGGQVGPIGFATVVDSLAAIKHLVFDTRQLSMEELLQALNANFEGHDLARALCASAPKFGNDIPWVDALGRRLERFMVSLCRKHRNFYGGTPQLFYVPVICHKAMGRATGATPDGRRAGDILSEGVSPSLGAAVEGPLAVFGSAVASKAEDMEGLAARFLMVSLTPAHLAGSVGRHALMALVRTWVRQRHWHLQVHMCDRGTLLAASNMPERYRHWSERLPGHSARYTCLNREQQESLIANRQGRVGKACP